MKDKNSDDAIALTWAPEDKGKTGRWYPVFRLITYERVLPTQSWQSLSTF